MHDGAVIPSPDGDHRAVVMPELSTARLHLAPVAEEDLEELFALHSDPRAFAEDVTDPVTDRAQMRWVLARWRESWERHGLGYLTVRADRPSALRDGLLGVVGLTPLEDDPADGRAGTMGGPVVPSLSAYWRLAPAETGHGLATEAMRAVLSHPRLGGRGTELVAVTAARNRPSRALAARLGFVPAPPDRPVPGGRAGDVLLVRPAS